MPDNLITKFKAATLDDLIEHLQVSIEANNGVIVSISNLTSTAEGKTEYFHEVEYFKRPAGTVVKPVEYHEFKSAEEAAQRLEMAEVLSQGNCPVCYSRLTFIDANGVAIATNIFFYRPDGGAWLATVTKPAISADLTGTIPWSKAKRSQTTYQGLSKDGISYFPKTGGGNAAVVTVTDADIDTDGPGGSKAVDPYWLPNTSLTDANGKSCDSRKFLGVVIPPGLTHEFGIRTGDFALLIWKDKQVPVQVYDVGPSTKIGEISFGAALALGIHTDSSPAGEKAAATRGNSVKDLMTVFFPGSGGGKAVAQEQTTEAVKKRLADWLAPAAPAVAPAPAAPVVVAAAPAKPAAGG